MNLLIDIGHPAHVHLFKNFAEKLKEKGHNIFYTVRTGEKEAHLLEYYKSKYQLIGSKKTKIIGKLAGVIVFSIRIYLISLRYKTDIFISHGSMYAGYAALLRRKPHITLEDSGNMEQLRFSIPVSSVVIAPEVLKTTLGPYHISYSSYHELAYLSPKYFCPDKNVKSLLKISTEQRYCILRFASWAASHDIKQKGLTNKVKKDLINYLAQRMKIYIVSEKELDPEFKKYEYPLESYQLHDAIASAEIIISEGATIASEAGVLGIPSIYVNSIERCYNEDLEKYGLVYNFRNSEGVIKKIEEILNIPNYKFEFQERRNRMLNDKIDITSFLTWFVEKYPESERIMKSDPDYQFKFR